MKGSLACCLAASALVPVERLAGPQYIVCTADEEVGSAGAAQVARESRFFREMVARQTVGVIGEPTGWKWYTPTRGSTGSAPCRGDGPRTRPSARG